MQMRHDYLVMRVYHPVTALSRTVVLYYMHQKKPKALLEPIELTHAGENV